MHAVNITGKCRFIGIHISMCIKVHKSDLSSQCRRCSTHCSEINRMISTHDNNPVATTHGIFSDLSYDLINTENFILITELMITNFELFSIMTNNITFVANLKTDVLEFANNILVAKNLRSIANTEVICTEVERDTE